MDNYVIIASLKCEPMGKLINRIPRLCLLISSLPSSARRTHVESLGMPHGSTSVLKALPGKLDTKRHSPIIICFYVTIEDQDQGSSIVVGGSSI